MGPADPITPAARRESRARGRPPLPAHERLTTSIEVRLTAGEAAALRALAAQHETTVSRVVRRHVRRVIEHFGA